MKITYSYNTTRSPGSVALVEERPKKVADRGSGCRVELGVKGYLKKVEHFGLAQ